MYDVIIIGAGPAGMGAGVYAAKHKLKALVLAKKIQEFVPTEQTEIFSYENLLNQFRKLINTAASKLEFKDKQEIIGVEKNVVSFSVENKAGQIFYAKNIILTYGSGNEVGLENISNKSADGKIKVDHYMQTNVPGLFAAGAAAIGGRKDAFISASEGAKAVSFIGQIEG